MSWIFKSAATIASRLGLNNEAFGCSAAEASLTSLSNVNSRVQSFWTTLSECCLSGLQLENSYNAIFFREYDIRQPQLSTTVSVIIPDDRHFHLCKGFSSSLLLEVALDFLITNKFMSHFLVPINVFPTSEFTFLSGASTKNDSFLPTNCTGLDHLFTELTQARNPQAFSYFCYIQHHDVVCSNVIALLAYKQRWWNFADRYNTLTALDTSSVVILRLRLGQVGIYCCRNLFLIFLYSERA